MTQASVDFQKLLNLEQERHLQEEELQEIEKVEIPFPLEKTMKELNQDIFLDDKAIKNYSSTKIKARNFLTNVSYIVLQQLIIKITTSLLIVLRF